MARTSNKDKAIAYAAERNIILTVEDRDNFDGDYAVEVWSLDAHLSEQNSYCHTYFARGNTEPRAWADALAYMERLTECADDCSCRDSGQDQDDTLTMTEEYHRLGAIQGLVLDKDGSVLFDLYDEFGVPEPAAIEIDLTRAGWTQDKSGLL